MVSADLSGSAWILTRPRDRSESWKKILEDHGAIVEVAPVLKLEPLNPGISWGRWTSKDLLIFSSATTVRHFFSLLPESYKNAWESGDSPLWAAVGSATGDQIRENGFQVTYQGPGTGAEGLVETIVQGSQPGRAAHITSDAGLPVIRDLLISAGYDCDRLEVSRSILDPDLRIDEWSQIRSEWSGIIYSSPATVRGVIDQSGDHVEWIRSIPGVAVGHRTGTEMQKLGIRKTIVASHAEPSAVIEACASLISTGNRGVDPQD